MLVKLAYSDHLWLVVIDREREREREVFSQENIAMILGHVLMIFIER